MTNQQDTITIRVGNNTLAFSIPDSEGNHSWHKYAVRSGMSIAANLRMAFKEEEFLSRPFKKAILCVSTPIVLIPAEEYNNTPDLDVEEMYASVITGRKGERKVVNEVEGLDVMALFPVNTDLEMVVGDHYPNVEVHNVMEAVWSNTYDKHYKSNGPRKMFAFFHDKTVDIFAFEQRRLHFANNFDAAHAHDALYYMLFVWKQLGMNKNEDEIYVAGEMPHEEWLMGRLENYIANIKHEDNNGTI